MKHPDLLNKLSNFVHDESGAAILEFTLVILFLLPVTFAVFEVSYIGWQWNRAEKATQFGVRFAIQSDPVEAAFTNWSAYVSLGVNPGESIVQNPFNVRCDNTACSVTSGALPTGWSTDHDPDAFNAILDRVQRIFPDVDAINLLVEYQHVGLGYSDRRGTDLIPVVRVRLTGMVYDTIFLEAFGMGDTFPMGDFAATLPGEDLESSAPF